jgi:hypothetical protein
MTLVGKPFGAIANSSNAIRTGNVVARRKIDSTVEMLYHCVTVSGELKAGQAFASFTHNSENRLCMHLDWQWLTGDRSKGRSDWVLETS